MVPIEHERTERVVRTVVFLAPPTALVVGGWLAWGGALHWHDLVVLAIFYALTGLGITVGYHRLFTHRSFRTTRTVRALLAVFGSMAVEGPLLEWVATHRKHHQFSDHAGDPHSPHTEDAPGWRGALRGLGHAHMGWMMRGRDKPNPRRYAKDLLADRDLCFISRTFPLWAVVGPRPPVRSRPGVDGHDRRRAHRPPVGRSRPHLPAPPRDLQHQLAVPLLRPATVRKPAISRATSPGSHRSPSARRGTTTTTPSPPPPAMD